MPNDDSDVATLGRPAPWWVGLFVIFTVAGFGFLLMLVIHFLLIA